jgi:hypothetical protein
MSLGNMSRKGVVVAGGHAARATLVANFSSNPNHRHRTLDYYSNYSNDCGGNSRERSQTVSSYYNQSAIDAAAAKVSLPLSVSKT